MSKKLPKLSMEPYKGVRDFYPEDMAVRRYLFSVMRETAGSFGYSEYSASILEPLELYKGKTSEEIVKEQTYSFKDRGGRDITLRPEMTPTIGRMVAARRRELVFPLRWYSIPNIFRYERPQRGRLREHWQLNCDLFGVSGIEAEVEVISLAYRLMKNFGAKDDTFEICLNSRVALDHALAKAGLSPEKSKEMLRLIDRKDAIEDFEAQAVAIAGKPFAVPDIEPQDVAEVRSSLAELGIHNAIYDPLLARGFDYYTGIVFEIFDTGPENHRSLFGGGRYDNLLELFGAEKIPAVGFGMGDVTLHDFLETHGLLPHLPPLADLYLCTATKEAVLDALKLAERLRAQKVRVIVNLTDRKVGDQIKTADRQRVPHIAVIGPDEVKSGTVTLRNLNTGEEQTLAEADIASALQNRR